MSEWYEKNRNGSALDCLSSLKLELALSILRKKVSSCSQSTKDLPIIEYDGELLGWNYLWKYA